MKQYSYYVFFLFLLMNIYATLNTKVLIFTYAFNRPDFLEIQHKTFKKFMLDEYEFVVFNDANNSHMEQAITQKAHELGVTHIRIPQDIHNRPYLQRWPGEQYNHPTVRNVNVVMYSLNTLGFLHDDILMLLDSDMFLVKPLQISSLMKNYDIGGRFLTPGNRIGWIGEITYLWHGLAFLNMKRMPNKSSINFNCGRIDSIPIDAGGFSYYYLKQNPHINILSCNHVFSNELKCQSCKDDNINTCIHNKKELLNAGLDKHQVTFFQSVHNGHANGLYSVELFLNNSFLHYRCGTNWENQTSNFHLQKTNALLTYINAITQ